MFGIGKKRPFKGPWSNTAELVISQAAELAVVKIVESKEISEEELSDKAKKIVQNTLNELALTVAQNVWRNAESMFAKENYEDKFPSHYYRTWTTTVPQEQVKDLLKDIIEESPAYAAFLKMDGSQDNGGFKPKTDEPKPKGTPPAAKPKKKK